MLREWGGKSGWIGGGGRGGIGIELEDSKATSAVKGRVESYSTVQGEHCDRTRHRCRRNADAHAHAYAHADADADVDAEPQQFPKLKVTTTTYSIPTLRKY